MPVISALVMARPPLPVIARPPLPVIARTSPPFYGYEITAGDRHSTAGDRPSPATARNAPAPLPVIACAALLFLARYSPFAAVTP